MNPSALSSTIVVEPVDLRLPVESAVVSFACATRPAILESSLNTSSYGRFSIFSCDPVAEFVANRGDRGCAFSRLAERVAACSSVTGGPGGVPFAGGWIGYFAYEAGLGFERVPSTTHWDVPMPLARFHLYDAAAAYDHRAEQWYVIAVDWAASVARGRPSVASRLAALRERLTLAAIMPPPDSPRTPTTWGVRANMSRAAYCARVRRAKRYIESGDIYQVNLTQRFTARTDATPLALYRRLRQSSPSPYAALLPWDGVTVLSSSPELFLDLRDGHVVTRPIKGTRPRVGHPRVDAIRRRELCESEKERAELTMIVDLLRNDLGRVCKFGSIRVTDAGKIEEHPTVFHRVATIEGDLAPRRNRLHLLQATFPGGSITGAPKIRAMQIIDELEPTGRGVYCGSIGWIGLDGSMALNIAIRTMVQTQDAVHFYAGGAIVADSIPEEEYDETLAKAAGMMRALACEAPTEAHRETPKEVTVA